jgi:hypothetical protein
LDTYKTNEVEYKGGEELSQNYWNSTPIGEEEWAFFSSDFTFFYIFDPEKEHFTKVSIDTQFFIEKRDFFNLNTLSNNTIILLGGKNAEKIYTDAYLLLNYKIERNLKFTWNRLDLNGFVCEGYCGQTTITFPNDSIILFGGILNNFDPIDQKEYTIDPKICNRLQIINYNDLVTWKLTKRVRNIITYGKPNNPDEIEHTKVTKSAFMHYLNKLIQENLAQKLKKKKKRKGSDEEKKIEAPNEIEEQKNFENDKIKINMCLNRLSHISFILRNEIENDKDYLVIHGGETYGKILSDLQFYDLTAGKWINPKFNKLNNNNKDKEIYPQLKFHAWTYFRYVDEDIKRKKKPKKNQSNYNNYNKFNNNKTINNTNLNFTNNNNNNGTTVSDNILFKVTSEADRLGTKYNNNASMFVEYLNSQKIKSKDYLISSLNNTVNNYLYNPTNIEDNEIDIDLNKISEIMGVNTNIMTTNKKTENFLVDNINLNQNMHTNNLGNQSQIISQNTNNIIENDFSLFQDDEEYYEKFILISGGLGIFHQCKIPTVIGNKPIDIKNKIFQRLTNEERLICDCKEEYINDTLYMYKRGKFTEVEIQKNPLDESLSSELLERFGHNFVFNANLKLCFCLFGFMKFNGFIFDIVQVNVIREPKNRIKTICDLDKFEEIRHAIPGRIHASVIPYKDYLIVYGGVSNKKTMDDLWIINLDDKSREEKKEENEIVLDNDDIKKIKAKISIRKVENDYINFNPRYGCSTICYKSNLLDVNEKKVIIFGGSVYFTKENKYEGMINEILMMKITVYFFLNFVKIFLFIYYSFRKNGMILI